LNDRSQADLGQASASSLLPLFRPKTIAFIGASERPNTPASRGLRHCLRLGFKGGLYPVNPKHQTLYGVPCFPSLESVPEKIDLAMIAVSADATLEAIKTCQALGVKMVVACSAGWEEIGDEAGMERARKLRELMAGSSMRLLGPNCMGSANPALGMCLAYNSSFETISFPRPGRVGLVTQSGAMLGGVALNGEDAGWDVGIFAHVGNATDIGMEEVIEYMADDPEVKVIALMIEGIRQPQRFVAAARRARAAGKPVVAFKAGSSDLGRQAVQSHTGALAGSDEVFSAMCRELGIIRVAESEDLMATASALANWADKAPIGQGRLLIYTLSGGAASIAADECNLAGIEVPPLSAKTLADLSQVLPPYVHTNNPLDVGGGVFSDPDLPGKSLAIAVRDEGVDAVLWIGVAAPRDPRSCAIMDQTLDVLEACAIPSVIVPVSGYLQEPGFERARKLGIPVVRSVRAAIQLVANAASLGRQLPAAGKPAQSVPALPEGALIDELRSKALLGELGIPVPGSALAASVEEAVRAAERIGFPVVVKGVVEGVAHKSEMGIVKLGLASADAVREAATDIARRAQGHELRGFLVEQMVRGGIEVVLGIKRDPGFGPILMFGLGGVAVELFQDVAFGSCPLSPEGARELIGRTRAARLLRGYRGQPPADEAALVDAMVRLSQFAAHHADELDEMDVNPLVVLPQGKGVLALDAVLVRRKDGE
jgi:acetyltransferase